MQTDSILDSLTFTVPLSRDAHEIAHQFRQNPFEAEQAQQVYLNTLSIYAVNFYLKCMGFDPDWQSSDSFNSLQQKFMDTADLNVRNLGRFECRPVLSHQQMMLIPLESFQHRRGYFAVQLNPQLTQAEILGFVKQVRTEVLPLNQLESLDVFLRYASRLERATQLNQWFQHQFEAGWDTIENLLSIPQIAWRSPSNTVIDNRLKTADYPEIERIKRLTLKPTDQQVGLLVRLTPRTEVETGIGVEVYPTDHQTYLPENLNLILLDEAGKAVMQAEARTTKNIQLQFSAESGEAFSVKISLGQTSVIEMFVV